MTVTIDADRDPERLNDALRLVLRRYGAQIRRRAAIAIPAVLLPALGDVLTVYAPPLVVAKLLGTFARQEHLSPADLAPYVLTFAGLWLAGQIVWRIAVALIIRAEIRGIEGALHRSDGRAAGQGSVVLSEQLCRLAHQARAGVRTPLRGRVRRPQLPDGGDPCFRWGSWGSCCGPTRHG